MEVVVGTMTTEGDFSGTVARSVTTGKSVTMVHPLDFVFRFGSLRGRFEDSLCDTSMTRTVVQGGGRPEVKGRVRMETSIGYNKNKGLLSSTYILRWSTEVL